MNINKKVIDIFKNIHKDTYDYSLVDYINNTTKVKIICKEHGVFEQTPQHHKRGSGCPKCGLRKIGVNRKLSNQQFIDNANNTHNNKYDYSLTNYIDNRKPIKIICKEHGVFEQIAASHLNGRGCPKCGLRYLSKEELLRRFNDMHKNKYKYRLDKDKYNTTDYIKIDCKKHGTFEQKIRDHLSGSGCQKCGGSIFTFSDFENRSNDIHKGKYDYSLVDYKKFNIPVKIICKKHGVFEQKPMNHFGGSGCPICNESRGEIIVRDFLNKNNIDFIPQKRFKDCFYKRSLPFDFYLPKYNICIEFNGIQHYQPVDAFGGNDGFLDVKKRDNIKYNFCKSNAIKLIIISYREIGDIDYILTENLL